MKLVDLGVPRHNAYMNIREDALPPDIHHPDAYSPPAYVQQMDQEELNRLQGQQEVPRYTTAHEPDQDERDTKATNSPNVLQFVDMQHVEDNRTRAGHFTHVETPAGIITYINGGIDVYMTDMFMDEYYNPVEPALIVLNSPGGEVRNIQEIADGIRTRSIPVYVPDGAICMSACNVMFAAGVGRYVGPNAEFMIHHVRYGGDQADGTRLAMKKSIDFFNLITNYIGDPRYYQTYMTELRQKLGDETMTWQNDDVRMPGSWIAEQGWARVVSNPSGSS